MKRAKMLGQTIVKVIINCSSNGNLVCAFEAQLTGKKTVIAKFKAFLPQ